MNKKAIMKTPNSVCLVKTGVPSLTLKTMIHDTHYRQRKNKQKSSPSALSDAEVPRPVSPLSDVPGRRPKRLWNFSDTAGVCHSMSANRANVYLWNRTMATEEHINTCWNNTQFKHIDSRVPTYPLVWFQNISVRLSFHTRQCHLMERRTNILSYCKKHTKRILVFNISHNCFDIIITGHILGIYINID